MESGSSSSPPAAAASCSLPWVMLSQFGYPQDTMVAEAKTTAAAACTSTNLLFQVSLLLAAPPANSRLHYGWCHSASSEAAEGEEVTVVAAHRGAVLLDVSSTQKRDPYGRATKTWDYFLYETGGAGRPPSLLKLPGCYFLYRFEHNDGEGEGRERPRIMDASDTGVLRCGKDDDGDLLLVAQLDVSGSDKPRDRADLCVLRAGQEWEHKRAVPIIFGDHPGSSSNVAMPCHWQADTAVPVGDRFLCWVDYNLGFLFCDMAAAADDDASLKLRYVMLPAVPPKSVEYSWDDRPYLRFCRDMAGAGAGAVRFVNVELRCCCGDHGSSTCPSGQFLFTVTTWTLSLSMDEPLEWVKDGVLDCVELWRLPAYKGLPQVKVKLPMVSLDNPDVIRFVVPEDVKDYAKFADRKVWMVEVDTRSKALVSVVPYTDMWNDSHRAAKFRLIKPATSKS